MKKKTQPNIVFDMKFVTLAGWTTFMVITQRSYKVITLS